MHYSLPLIVWFWMTVLVSALAMKLSSLKAARLALSPMDFVLLSPVFSTVSWKKKVAVDRALIRRILIRGVLLFLPFAASWRLYLTLVPPIRPSVLAQSYLALIPLYCMGEFASVVFEFVYLPTGWHFPAHHRFPPLSKTLAEFWGSRWATWVADWLRQMVFDRYRRRPVLGLFAAFFLSGLWHELLINVPLYLFYRVNVLGSMLLYFSIQALGILGERKFSLGEGLLHRVYTWAVVVIPAPLVMNEGVLRAVGLFVS